MFTKDYLYKRLFEIEKDNVNVDNFLRQLAQGYKDEAIEFVKSYNELSIPDFINKLVDKKFYYTLTDKRSSTNDKAKALSSLITHTLIEYSHGKTDLARLSKSIKLNNVLNSLQLYCLEGNSKAIDDVAEELRNLFIEIRKIR